MKKYLWLFLLLFCTAAYAVPGAKDIRISDNDGDVLNINADGTLPISGLSVDSNGNVGIGTTTPMNKLSVIGEIVGYTIANSGRLISATTGTFGINADPALAIMGGTGGNTNITTTGTGGIGAPVIIEAGRGGMAPLANTSSTGGQGGDVFIRAGEGGAATATGTNIGGPAGTLYLIGGTGGVAVNGSGNTDAVGGDVVIKGGRSLTTGGNAYLLGGYDGSNSGNIYIAMEPDGSRHGLVGIGTYNITSNALTHTYINSNSASWEALLQNGSTSTGGLVRYAVTNSGGEAAQLGALTSYGTGNVGTVFGQTIGNYVGLTASGTAVNGLLIGATTSDPVIFGTNNTERMQINAGGNVGIGTSLPIQTLEVKGTFAVRGAQTSPWSKKTGANTACDTTCGTSMCAFGVDDTNKLPLACSDNTADTCICMGP